MKRMKNDWRKFTGLDGHFSKTRMKNRIYQKLFPFSLVILAGNGFLGYAIYKSNQKLSDSELWVQHTEQVIARSASIGSIASDIETASRGFVITDDNTFLEQFNTVEKTVLVYIGQLRQLTGDNPVQQQRIDSLAFYMHKHLDFSYQTISIRGKEGLISAIAYISTKQGKHYTDRIRQITRAIEQEEEALLKQRKQTNEGSAAVFDRFAVIMFISMSGFTILLLIAIGKYWIQNKEKELRAGELIIANKELAFQNVEKEKRAKELIVANIELAFQNEEKGKRAGELMVANVELAFQNEEKEKRAGELMVANIELAFQSEEKEKRATELVIANKELAFQNKEKEKRASELVLANEELAFQSEEKEKRATELIIANKELAFQNEEKEKKAEELSIANWELKKAEDDIRKFNKEDIRKLNEELEQKVVARTAQLESANQELESFSYSVSHDLRTPLRAVNGYAKMLEEDYADLFDDEGRRKLAVVQNNAKKMGVLIDDLLAFSRLGRQEIKKSVVNMTALVENALAELRASQQFKAVVTINDLHPAIADTTLMAQVWVNLLSNAIKYSSNNKQPVIKIESEKKNDELIYSISDNGVGFDMKYGHKLFGVFQRLHSSKDFEGTGVGLALVHRIITKQGGKIWAKAEINKGATFYFSLPEKH
jgi:signal transduction histidine kinase